jgi:hypothetical protein
VARPKRLKAAAPLDQSAKQLLVTIQQSLRKSGFLEEGEEDYNPVVLLARMSKNPRVKDDLRIKAAEAVARYTHTQLKALEVGGGANREPIKVQITQYGDVAERDRHETVIIPRK